MKIEELRIGNWVMYGDMNAPIIIPCGTGQVKAITLFGELDFSTPQLDIKVPVKHCSGIPLTPEILEKAGFVKNTEMIGGGTFEYSDYRLGNFVCIFGKWEGAEVEYAPSFETVKERGHVCKVQYLHSFQNLYFCLCGSELTIHSL